MQCPVPHNDTVLPADHPAVPAASLSAATSGSDTPASSSITPSFQPNAPASALPKEGSLAALLYESGDADGIRPTTVDEWPLPADLDMARPVSELLRKGTQRAHVAAEHSDGAVALTNGQLELQEYVRWLAVIWRVYDVLETGLATHAGNPVLSPTYNPTLLARAPEVAKDITFLLKRLPKAVSAPSKRPLALAPGMALPPFPLPPFLEEVFVFTPSALQVYLDRLSELAASEALAPRLLAHAYVRYLGDLSGGQIIGARMRKAYGLPGLDGRRFYYFDMGGDSAAAEAGEETVGERKKKLNDVKTWYRTGMDEGAGDSADLKAALVKEANVAFMLNTHLFSLINPPTAEKPRYYEKIATEKERRERLAGPPPSLSERLVRMGWMLAAAFLIIALLQVAAPHLEPHVRPVWDQTISPVLADTVVPWYNTHAVPVLETVKEILQRTMAAQTRQLL